MQHLTSTKFQEHAGRQFLTLCYTDGIQVFDLTEFFAALENRKVSDNDEFCSLGLDVSEAFNGIIHDGAAIAILISNSSQRPIQSRKARKTIPTTSSLGDFSTPLVAYVPLSNLSELRICDSSDGSLKYRLELFAPITDLHIAYHDGFGSLLICSHRQIRVFDLFDLVRLTSIPVAASSASPAIAIIDNMLWVEAPASHLLGFDWVELKPIIESHLLFERSGDDSAAGVTQSLTNCSREGGWLDCGISPRGDGSGMDLSENEDITPSPCLQPPPAASAILDDRAVFGCIAASEQTVAVANTFGTKAILIAVQSETQGNADAFIIAHTLYAPEAPKAFIASKIIEKALGHGYDEDQVCCGVLLEAGAQQLDFMVSDRDIFGVTRFRWERRMDDVRPS